MEVSGQLRAPAALPLRETAPTTHCIGGWAGPKAGQNAMEKREISFMYRESNRNSLVVQPVA
jgi:hypothetical protein